MTGFLFGAPQGLYENPLGFGKQHAKRVAQDAVRRPEGVSTLRVRIKPPGTRNAQRSPRSGSPESSSTLNQRNEFVQTSDPINPAFDFNISRRIEQHRPHPSLSRPKHIPPRIIADKHCLVRANA
jgi:hypothetical protein